MRWRLFTRDTGIYLIASALLIHESLGSKNPAVLTACTSLLLSPMILRADEARRDRANGDARPPIAPTFRDRMTGDDFDRE